MDDMRAEGPAGDAESDRAAAAVVAIVAGGKGSPVGKGGADVAGRPAVRRISGVIDAQTARSLSAGDQVLYSGQVYTARDAAHARLVNLLDAGEPLPFDIVDAIIYYAGPAPAKPGQVIGSVGPTSSYRMDPYAPRLLDLGQRAMIGKGARSQAVVDAVARNDAVYFAAVGGAAALIAKSVKAVRPVCYEDLGTEAIRLLTVEDMPLTVAIDCHGGNIYESGPAAYLASLQ